MLSLPDPNDSGENTLFLVRPQRLIKLLSLLESGDAWTVQQLSEAFYVSRRTIFRDLQLLRNTNVPIVFDPVRECYRLRANGGCRCAKTSSQWLAISVGAQLEGVCNCPKIRADEIAALVLAIKILGPLPESIAGTCNRALAKILAAASPAARQQVIAILDQREEADHLAREEILELRPSG